MSHLLTVACVDSLEIERRAGIAVRLKAARWLAGEAYRDVDKKGQPRWRVRALTPEDLAERPPLRENGLSAGIIGEIERLDRPVFPMELEKITEALGVASDYFVSPLYEGDHGPAGDLRRELLGDPPSDQAPPGEGEVLDPPQERDGRA